MGIMTLTIQYTMGSTHTWGGVNYADAFNSSMMVIGLALLLLGAGLFVNWNKLLAFFHKPAIAFDRN
jgi:hypothetical protein